MKTMLNIGIIGLLFVLTACPKKEDVVEPKNVELIGKWVWESFSCDNWWGAVTPSDINQRYLVDFNFDSVKFYCNDTFLLSSTYKIELVDTNKFISVHFTKSDSNLKLKYRYLWFDGKYKVYHDRLFINPPICYTRYSRQY